ncbi:MAG TPA: hypothetical protein PLR41_14020 [Alphaproteobacteria bacterium]|nr:hypothetical protein [Alphaproteobacteria bacterium]
MGTMRPALSFARVAGLIRGLIAAGILAVVPLAPAAAQNWYFPHFNGGNSGFFSSVETAPAGAGSISIPNIGTFANGAGPVIGPDGTLYLGNQQGELMAFREDGARLWTVNLSGGERIVASAMVWNGDIYVVGQTDTDAALYRFNPSGGEVYRAPFPPHRPGTIMTTAPNISFTPVIGSNAQKALVVLPVAYKVPNAPVYETHVLLFFDDGQLSVDQKIDTVTPTTTGSFGSATISPGAPDLELPLPMAASWTDIGTGISYVAVADGFQTLVVYRTTANGLIQTAIWKQTDRLRSFVVTPNLGQRTVAAYSSQGYLIAYVDGSNEYRLPAKKGLSPITTTFSTTFAVSLDQVLINNPSGDRDKPLAGRSIAAVAVSKNYAYVSSEDALTTFNAIPDTYEQVARFDWVGGGRNPPVIGANGRVYAIASNILFIFPPPKAPGMISGTNVLKPGKPKPGANTPPEPGVGTDFLTTNDPAAQPQPTSTLPPTQLYKPPMTANGNRLFACKELDQDDCGKGDYREIALAWCQKQGYAKVSGYDVDGRKVRAETLDGQFCSKNKCKVFDSIGCEN